MADFFRVQLGVVSRSDGHSAAKRSAYQACGKAVDHDGRAFDFSRKRKEHVRTIMLAPEGSPGWVRKPELLWQRAAAAEKRVDAQEARIVDFSMPRQIPQALWEACIRDVYSPFLERGMVMQIDIHDTPASDGGRNINIHGLATLRPIDADAFSLRKDRTWNDMFRERSGRAVREMFATKLTAFCQAHGIAYEGDARPNSQRDLPNPEPHLPKWNFEAYARTHDMPEALAALHNHRTSRRAWAVAQTEAAEATLEVTLLERRSREERQRRTIPSAAGQRSSSKGDRRAAILRTWYRSGWIGAETIPSIRCVRFDEQRDHLWINLADGTALIDRGDVVTLKGPVTWMAALETAAAANRHGWQSVEVHGDQAYKDAVAVACILNGIEVTNHILSPNAQAKLEELVAQQAVRSKKPNDLVGDRAPPSSLASKSAPMPSNQGPSSREIHLALSKRISHRTALQTEPPEVDDFTPGLKPKFPARRQERGGLRRSDYDQSVLE